MSLAVLVSRGLFHSWCVRRCCGRNCPWQEVARLPRDLAVLRLSCPLVLLVSRWQPPPPPWLPRPLLPPTSIHSPSRQCVRHGSPQRTRMWANAQRDGRPAKHRWRPLFNAAKFRWRPLLECLAVTLPRRETRWNLQGCPKLANKSQPLVGRSSPYCEDIWGRYCCLTIFPIVCRYVP